jgi:phospholipase/carboxylesterase
MQAQVTEHAHIPSNGQAKRLVIMLHGLGADGADLFDLVPSMAGALADTAFLSVDAPFPCDMAPQGRQWFSLREWTESSMLVGAREVAPFLADYIQNSARRFNLPLQAVFLLGFSQGAMMAMHVGPRLPETLGGIIAFSGALIAPYHLATETTQKPPVCLIHGMADMVVPFAAMNMAEHALKTNGFTVVAHPRPMLGHGIDPQGIQSAIEFIRQKS